MNLARRDGAARGGLCLGFRGGARGAMREGVLRRRRRVMRDADRHEGDADDQKDHEPPRREKPFVNQPRAAARGDDGDRREQEQAGCVEAALSLRLSVVTHSFDPRRPSLLSAASHYCASEFTVC